MSTSFPANLNTAKVAGPLLLGHLLQWGLFGALSVQVYIFYLAFSNDPLQRKILVYGVYAAELAQVILLSKMAFQEFAVGFGSFHALDDIGLLWFAVPILSATVAAVVQCFYAYRIRVLAQSNIIPMIVVLFAMTQLAGGIAQGVVAEEIPLFSKFLVKKTFITVGLWNGGSAACDVVIAGAMTYYLSQRKSTWKQTQQVVQRLLRLVIETGTLTAVIATLNLILYLIPNQRSYFQSTSAVLGKLYSNTMMVVLNSRIVFSRIESGSTELTSVATNHEFEVHRRPVFSSINGIRVMRAREHWSDPDPLSGEHAYKINGAKELEGSSETYTKTPVVLEESNGRL